MIKVLKKRICQHRKKVIFFMEYPCLLITILIFFFTGFSCLSTGEPVRRPVGGPCKYNKYKGLARIISIHKKEPPKKYGGPSYESYEVKFSFHTDQIIRETYGQVEGKQYLLLLKNSWYPGTKFLRKYGIEAGKYFECYLNVITKGTCTPVIFEFSAINLSDYFENQKSP